ncbi:hypothetical protein HYV86_01965 [Candidatus Woesearchaeota archaeon]|nr:hypothetical protein [Candidatus Woesearchaeota archaeon]
MKNRKTDAMVVLVLVFLVLLALAVSAGPCPDGSDEPCEVGGDSGSSGQLGDGVVSSGQDFSDMSPADQQQWLFSNPTNPAFADNAQNYLSGKTSFDDKDSTIAQNYLSKADFTSNSDAVSIGDKYYGADASRINADTATAQKYFKGKWDAEYVFNAVGALQYDSVGGTLTHDGLMITLAQFSGDKTVKSITTQPGGFCIETITKSCVQDEGKSGSSLQYNSQKGEFSIGTVTRAVGSSGVLVTTPITIKPEGTLQVDVKIGTDGSVHVEGDASGLITTTAGSYDFENRKGSLVINKDGSFSITNGELATPDLFVDGAARYDSTKKIVETWDLDASLTEPKSSHGSRSVVIYRGAVDSEGNNVGVVSSGQTILGRPPTKVTIHLDAYSDRSKFKPQEPQQGQSGEGVRERMREQAQKIVPPVNNLGGNAEVFIKQTDNPGVVVTAKGPVKVGFYSGAGSFVGRTPTLESSKPFFAGKSSQVGVADAEFDLLVNPVEQQVFVRGQSQFSEGQYGSVKQDLTGEIVVRGGMDLLQEGATLSLSRQSQGSEDAPPNQHLPDFIQVDCKDCAKGQEAITIGKKVATGVGKEITTSFHYTVKEDGSFSLTEDVASVADLAQARMDGTLTRAVGLYRGVTMQTGKDALGSNQIVAMVPVVDQAAVAVFSEVHRADATVEKSQTSYALAEKLGGKVIATTPENQAEAQKFLDLLAENKISELSGVNIKDDPALRKYLLEKTGIDVTEVGNQDYIDRLLAKEDRFKKFQDKAEKQVVSIERKYPGVDLAEDGSCVNQACFDLLGKGGRFVYDQISAEINYRKAANEMLTAGIGLECQGSSAVAGKAAALFGLATGVSCNDATAGIVPTVIKDNNKRLKPLVAAQRQIEARAAQQRAIAAEKKRVEQQQLQEQQLAQDPIGQLEENADSRGLIEADLVNEGTPESAARALREFAVEDQAKADALAEEKAVLQQRLTQVRAAPDRSRRGSSRNLDIDPGEIKDIQIESLEKKLAVLQQQESALVANIKADKAQIRSIVQTAVEGEDYIRAADIAHLAGMNYLEREILQNNVMPLDPLRASALLTESYVYREAEIGSVDLSDQAQRYQDVLSDPTTQAEMAQYDELRTLYDEQKKLYDEDQQIIQTYQDDPENDEKRDAYEDYLDRAQSGRAVVELPPAPIFPTMPESIAQGKNDKDTRIELVRRAGAIAARFSGQQNQKDLELMVLDGIIGISGQDVTKVAEHRKNVERMRVDKEGWSWEYGGGKGLLNYADMFGSYWGSKVAQAGLIASDVAGVTSGDSASFKTDLFSYDTELTAQVDAENADAFDSLQSRFGAINGRHAILKSMRDKVARGEATLKDVIEKVERYDADFKPEKTHSPSSQGDLVAASGSCSSSALVGAAIGDVPCPSPTKIRGQQRESLALDYGWDELKATMLGEQASPEIKGKARWAEIRDEANGNGGKMVTVEDKITDFNWEFRGAEVGKYGRTAQNNLEQTIGVVSVGFLEKYGDIAIQSASLDNFVPIGTIAKGGQLLFEAAKGTNAGIKIASTAGKVASAARLGLDSLEATAIGNRIVAGTGAVVRGTGSVVSTTFRVGKAIVQPITKPFSIVNNAFNTRFGDTATIIKNAQTAAKAELDVAQAALSQARSSSAHAADFAEIEADLARAEQAYTKTLRQSNVAAVERAQDNLQAARASGDAQKVEKAQAHLDRVEKVYKTHNDQLTALAQQRQRLLQQQAVLDAKVGNVETLLPQIRATEQKLRDLGEVFSAMSENAGLLLKEHLITGERSAAEARSINAKALVAQAKANPTSAEALAAARSFTKANEEYKLSGLFTSGGRLERLVGGGVARTGTDSTAADTIARVEETIAEAVEAEEYNDLVSDIQELERLGGQVHTIQSEGKDIVRFRFSQIKSEQQEQALALASRITDNLKTNSPLNVHRVDDFGNVLIDMGGSVPVDGLVSRVDDLALGHALETLTEFDRTGATSLEQAQGVMDDLARQHEGIASDSVAVASQAAERQVLEAVARNDPVRLGAQTDLVDSLPTPSEVVDAVTAVGEVPDTAQLAVAQAALDAGEPDVAAAIIREELKPVASSDEGLHAVIESVARGDVGEFVENTPLVLARKDHVAILERRVNPDGSRSLIVTRITNPEVSSAQLHEQVQGLIPDLPTSSRERIARLQEGICGPGGARVGAAVGDVADAGTDSVGCGCSAIEVLLESVSSVQAGGIAGSIDNGRNLGAHVAARLRVAQPGNVETVSVSALRDSVVLPPSTDSFTSELAQSVAHAAGVPSATSNVLLPPRDLDTVVDQSLVGGGVPKARRSFDEIVAQNAQREGVDDVGSINGGSVESDIVSPTLNQADQVDGAIVDEVITQEMPQLDFPTTVTTDGASADFVYKGSLDRNVVLEAARHDVDPAPLAGFEGRVAHFVLDENGNLMPLTRLDSFEGKRVISGVLDNEGRVIATAPGKIIDGKLARSVPIENEVHASNEWLVFNGEIAEYNAGIRATTGKAPASLDQILTSLDNGQAQIVQFVPTVNIDDWRRLTFPQDSVAREAVQGMAKAESLEEFAKSYDTFVAKLEEYDDAIANAVSTINSLRNVDSTDNTLRILANEARITQAKLRKTELINDLFESGMQEKYARGVINEQTAEHLDELRIAATKQTLEDIIFRDASIRGTIAQTPEFKYFAATRRGVDSSLSDNALLAEYMKQNIQFERIGTPNFASDADMNIIMPDSLQAKVFPELKSRLETTLRTQEVEIELLPMSAERVSSQAEDVARASNRVDANSLLNDEFILGVPSWVVQSMLKRGDIPLFEAGALQLEQLIKLNKYKDAGNVRKLAKHATRSTQATLLSHPTYNKMLNSAVGTLSTDAIDNYEHVKLVALRAFRDGFLSETQYLNFVKAHDIYKGSKSVEEVFGSADTAMIDAWRSQVVDDAMNSYKSLSTTQGAMYQEYGHLSLGKLENLVEETRETRALLRNNPADEDQIIRRFGERKAAVEKQFITEELRSIEGMNDDTLGQILSTYDHESLLSVSPEGLVGIEGVTPELAQAIISKSKEMNAKYVKFNHEIARARYEEVTGEALDDLVVSVGRGQRDTQEIAVVNAKVDSPEEILSQDDILNVDDVDAEIEISDADVVLDVDKDSFDNAQASLEDAIHTLTQDVNVKTWMTPGAVYVEVPIDSNIDDLEILLSNVKESAFATDRNPIIVRKTPSRVDRFGDTRRVRLSEVSSPAALQQVEVENLELASVIQSASVGSSHIDVLERAGVQVLIDSSGKRIYVVEGIPTPETRMLIDRHQRYLDSQGEGTGFEIIDSTVDAGDYDIGVDFAMDEPLKRQIQQHLAQQQLEDDLDTLAQFGVPSEINSGSIVVVSPKDPTSQITRIIERVHMNGQLVDKKIISVPAQYPLREFSAKTLSEVSHELDRVGIVLEIDPQTGRRVYRLADDNPDLRDLVKEHNTALEKLGDTSEFEIVGDSSERLFNHDIIALRERGVIVRVQDKNVFVDLSEIASADQTDDLDWLVTRLNANSRSIGKEVLVSKRTPSNRLVTPETSQPVTTGTVKARPSSIKAESASPVSSPSLEADSLERMVVQRAAVLDGLGVNVVDYNTVNGVYIFPNVAVEMRSKAIETAIKEYESALEAVGRKLDYEFQFVDSEEVLNSDIVNLERQGFSISEEGSRIKIGLPSRELTKAEERVLLRIDVNARDVGKERILVVRTDISDTADLDRVDRLADNELDIDVSEFESLGDTVAGRSESRIEAGSVVDSVPAASVQGAQDQLKANRGKVYTIDSLPSTFPVGKKVQIRMKDGKVIEGSISGSDKENIIVNLADPNTGSKGADAATLSVPVERSDIDLLVLDTPAVSYTDQKEMEKLLTKFSGLKDKVQISYTVDKDGKKVVNIGFKPSQSWDAAERAAYNADFEGLGRLQSLFEKQGFAIADKDELLDVVTNPLTSKNFIKELGLAEESVAEQRSLMVRLRDQAKAAGKDKLAARYEQDITVLDAYNKGWNRFKQRFGLGQQRPVSQVYGESFSLQPLRNAIQNAEGVFAARGTRVTIYEDIPDILNTDSRNVKVFISPSSQAKTVQQQKALEDLEKAFTDQGVSFSLIENGEFDSSSRFVNSKNVDTILGLPEEIEIVPVPESDAVAVVSPKIDGSEVSEVEVDEVVSSALDVQAPEMAPCIVGGVDSALAGDAFATSPVAPVPCVKMLSVAEATRVTSALERVAQSRRSTMSKASQAEFVVSRDGRTLFIVSADPHATRLAIPREVEDALKRHLNVEFVTPRDAVAKYNQFISTSERTIGSFEEIPKVQPSTLLDDLEIPRQGEALHAVPTPTEISLPDESAEVVGQVQAQGGEIVEGRGVVKDSAGKSIPAATQQQGIMRIGGNRIGVETGTPVFSPADIVAARRETNKIVMDQLIADAQSQGIMEQYLVVNSEGQVIEMSRVVPKNKQYVRVTVEPQSEIINVHEGVGFADNQIQPSQLGSITHEAYVRSYVAPPVQVEGVVDASSIGKANAQRLAQYYDVSAPERFRITNPTRSSIADRESFYLRVNENGLYDPSGRYQVAVHELADGRYMYDSEEVLDTTKLLGSPYVSVENVPLGVRDGLDETLNEYARLRALQREREKIPITGIREIPEELAPSRPVLATDEFTQPPCELPVVPTGTGMAGGGPCLKRVARADGTVPEAGTRIKLQSKSGNVYDGRYIGQDETKVALYLADDGTGSPGIVYLSKDRLEEHVWVSEDVDPSFLGGSSGVSSSLIESNFQVINTQYKKVMQTESIGGNAGGNSAGTAMYVTPRGEIAGFHTGQKNPLDPILKGNYELILRNDGLTGVVTEIVGLEKLPFSLREGVARAVDRFNTDVAMPELRELLPDLKRIYPNYATPTPYKYRGEFSLVPPVRPAVVEQIPASVSPVREAIRTPVPAPAVAPITPVPRREFSYTEVDLHLPVDSADRREFFNQIAVVAQRMGQPEIAAKYQVLAQQQARGQSWWRIGPLKRDPVPDILKAESEIEDGILKGVLDTKSGWKYHASGNEVSLMNIKAQRGISVRVNEGNAFFLKDEVKEVARSHPFASDDELVEVLRDHFKGRCIINNIGGKAVAAVAGMGTATDCIEPEITVTLFDEALGMPRIVSRVSDLKVGESGFIDVDGLSETTRDFMREHGFTGEIERLGSSRTTPAPKTLGKELASSAPESAANELGLDSAVLMRRDRSILVEGDSFEDVDQWVVKAEAGKIDAISADDVLSQSAASDLIRRHRGERQLMEELDPLGRYTFLAEEEYLAAPGNVNLVASRVIAGYTSVGKEVDFSALDEVMRSLPPEEAARLQESLDFHAALTVWSRFADREWGLQHLGETARVAPVDAGYAFSGSQLGWKYSPPNRVKRALDEKLRIFGGNDQIYVPLQKADFVTVDGAFDAVKFEKRFGTHLNQIKTLANEKPEVLKRLLMKNNVYNEEEASVLVLDLQRNSKNLRSDLRLLIENNGKAVVDENGVLYPIEQARKELFKMDKAPVSTPPRAMSASASRPTLASVEPVVTPPMPAPKYSLLVEGDKVSLNGKAIKVEGGIVPRRVVDVKPMSDSVRKMIPKNAHQLNLPEGAVRILDTPELLFTGKYWELPEQTKLLRVDHPVLSHLDLRRVRIYEVVTPDGSTSIVFGKVQFGNDLAKILPAAHEDQIFTNSFARDTAASVLLEEAGVLTPHKTIRHISMEGEPDLHIVFSEPLRDFTNIPKKTGLGQQRAALLDVIKERKEMLKEIYVKENKLTLDEFNQIDAALAGVPLNKNNIKNAIVDIQLEDLGGFTLGDQEFSALAQDLVSYHQIVRKQGWDAADEATDVIARAMLADAQLGLARDDAGFIRLASVDAGELGFLHVKQDGSDALYPTHLDVTPDGQFVTSRGKSVQGSNIIYSFSEGKAVRTPSRLSVALESEEKVGQLLAKMEKAGVDRETAAAFLYSAGAQEKVLFNNGFGTDQIRVIKTKVGDAPAREAAIRSFQLRQSGTKGISSGNFVPYEEMQARYAARRIAVQARVNRNVDVLPLDEAVRVIFPTARPADLVLNKVQRELTTQIGKLDVYQLHPGVAKRLQTAKVFDSSGLVKAEFSDKTPLEIISHQQGFVRRDTAGRCAIAAGAISGLAGCVGDAFDVTVDDLSAFRNNLDDLGQGGVFTFADNIGGSVIVAGSVDDLARNAVELDTTLARLNDVGFEPALTRYVASADQVPSTARTLTDELDIRWMLGEQDVGDDFASVASAANVVNKEVPPPAVLPSLPSAPKEVKATTSPLTPSAQLSPQKTVGVVPFTAPRGVAVNKLHDAPAEFVQGLRESGYISRRANEATGEMQDVIIVRTQSSANSVSKDIDSYGFNVVFGSKAVVVQRVDEAGATHWDLLKPVVKESEDDLNGWDGAKNQLLVDTLRKHMGEPVLASQLIELGGEKLIRSPFDPSISFGKTVSGEPFDIYEKAQNVPLDELISRRLSSSDIPVSSQEISRIKKDFVREGIDNLVMRRTDQELMLTLEGKMVHPPDSEVALHVGRSERTGLLVDKEPDFIHWYLMHVAGYREGHVVPNDVLSIRTTPVDFMVAGEYSRRRMEMAVRPRLEQWADMLYTPESRTALIEDMVHVEGTTRVQAEFILDKMARGSREEFIRQHLDEYDMILQKGNGNVLTLSTGEVVTFDQLVEREIAKGNLRRTDLGTIEFAKCSANVAGKAAGAAACPLPVGYDKYVQRLEAQIRVGLDEVDEVLDSSAGAGIASSGGSLDNGLDQVTNEQAYTVAVEAAGGDELKAVENLLGEARVAGNDDLAVRLERHLEQVRAYRAQEQRSGFDRAWDGLLRRSRVEKPGVPDLGNSNLNNKLNSDLDVSVLNKQSGQEGTVDVLNNMPNAPLLEDVDVFDGASLLPCPIGVRSLTGGAVDLPCDGGVSDASGVNPILFDVGSSEQVIDEWRSILSSPTSVEQLKSLGKVQREVLIGNTQVITFKNKAGNTVEATQSLTLKTGNIFALEINVGGETIAYQDFIITHLDDADVNSPTTLFILEAGVNPDYERLGLNRRLYDDALKASPHVSYIKAELARTNKEVYLDYLKRNPTASPADALMQTPAAKIRRGSGYVLDMQHSTLPKYNFKTKALDGEIIIVYKRETGTLGSELSVPSSARGQIPCVGGAIAGLAGDLPCDVDLGDTGAGLLDDAVGAGKDMVKGSNTPTPVVVHGREITPEEVMPTLPWNEGMDGSPIVEDSHWFDTKKDWSMIRDFAKDNGLIALERQADEALGMFGRYEEYARLGFLRRLITKTPSLPPQIDTTGVGLDIFQGAEDWHFRGVDDAVEPPVVSELNDLEGSVLDSAIPCDVPSVAGSQAIAGQAGNPCASAAGSVVRRTGLLKGAVKIGKVESKVEEKENEQSLSDRESERKIVLAQEVISVPAEGSTDNSVVLDPVLMQTPRAQIMDEQLLAYPGVSSVALVSANGGREVGYYVPDDVDISKPVTVVYFFHGLGEEKIKDTNSLKLSAKALFDSKSNAVLVFPTSAGRRGLDRDGNLLSYDAYWMSPSVTKQEENMDSLHTASLMALKGLMGSDITVGNVIIACHSAGGQACRNIAQSGGIQAVPTITYYEADSCYGSWCSEAAKAIRPSDKLKVEYQRSGSTRTKDGALAVDEDPRISVDSRNLIHIDFVNEGLRSVIDEDGAVASN